jgi:16S rRNA processing protein RimM
MTAQAESSPPEQLPADTVAVGRIRDAWGIAGSIRVEPFNAPRESVLRSVRRWWLVRPTEPHRPLPPPGATGCNPARVLQITRCRIHGEALVAQVRGVADRTAAEALKGFEIHISRADFPRPESGEYYWIDLIGCRVLGQHDAALGTVMALDDHGAHPILIIHDGDRERLVPFVDDYLIEVDIGARRIRIDWHVDW